MSKRGFGRIRRLPSGRYQARYLGPDGVDRPAPTTFAAKADAVAYLAMVQADIVRGKWNPVVPDAVPVEVTVREVAESWHSTGALRWRLRTAVDNRAVLDKDILPALGDVPVKGLTAEAVTQWYSGMPNVVTRRAHAYAVLRSVMNSAIDSGLIDRTPCRLKGAGRAPLRRETTKGVTIPEPKQIRKAAEAMPDHLVAMVYILGWVAIRPGELYELRRKDVAVDGTVITVGRSVEWVGNKAVVEMPKTTSGIRELDVPSGTAKVLKEHLEKYVGESPEALLFATRTGGHLRSQNVHRHWAKARVKAGIPTARLYDLRHTGLTRAAQSGATTAELMARAGHKTPAAAMIYQHAVRERGKELARRLSEMESAESE